MPDQQQQINYGAAPNDGQGDPLRDAFIKTDNNFDSIWNTGPVGSNVTILNNTIAVVNTNGNLTLKPNGVGVIQANASILPNTANIRDLGAADRRWRRVYLQTLNTVDYEVEGDLTVSGNLTIQGDTIQIGNLVTDAKTLQLSNTAANAAQATGSGITVGAADNIATFLYNSSINTWDTNIGLQINGNVTADYFIGNGSQLTGLPEQYGNSNVADFLATFDGDIQAGNLFVLTQGSTWTIIGRKITGPGGAYWLSNPAQELDIFAGAPGESLRIQSVDANSVVQTRVTMNDTYVEIFVENGVNHSWKFNETGITEFPGTITPVVSPSTPEYALGNVTNPWNGLYVSGNVYLGATEFSGNVTPSANATYSLGNATNQWANLWVANNTIYIGGVALGVTGNVLTVAGEPVLSNDSDSSITTTGNITANSFIGDGSLLTGISSTGNITFTDTTMSPPDGVDITISAANSEVMIEAFDIRLDATDDLRLTGNDIVSLRNRSVTDPVTIITDYDNSETTWMFAVDGTLTAPGDIVVAGDVTGTVSASTLLLKAQPASNTSIQLNNSVDSTVSIAANLDIVTDSSNTAQTWTFGTDGVLTAPGDVTTTGNISAGNVSAPNFLGNISAANVVGTVATATTAGTVTTAAQPNITSVGALSSLSVTGNITGGNILTDNYLYANGDPFSAGTTYTAGNGIDITSDVISVDANVVLTSGSQSIETTGNVTAANFIGNISITGNVTGTSSNVELVAGSYSYVFDNTGNTAFANGTVSLTDLSATGNITGNTAGFAIGYRDIPQVAFTGNVTMAAADAGKHFYSTESTDYILTIADNSAVSWPVGTAITVVNRGTGNMTIAQGSGVSLYLAGNNTAGNRTVTTYGMATVLNVAANVWMINGTGVS